LRRVVCRHRPDWMFEVADDLMRIYSTGSSSSGKEKVAKPPNAPTPKQARIQPDILTNCSFRVRIQTIHFIQKPL
jgi:hypothetical protein